MKLTTLTAAALLTACAHRPVPAPAPPALPAAWLHAATQAPADAATEDAPAWWRAYRESALDAAVAHALAHQGDVAAALLKLRNADLRAEAAGAALRPVPSGSLSANASRPLSGNAQRTTRGVGTAFGTAWEIDLWGRLAAQADMALWERDATALDADATAAALAASVVRQYWQLGALGQRLAVGAQSLTYARRTRDLTQTQYDAGAVSGLDLAQARQSVQQQELALLTLRQQHTEMHHALALLLGLLPGDVPAAWLPEQLPPGAAERARVRPGLPADLLARRPDVRAAETRLRASLANIDAQRLTFYPALSLTGSLGTSSTSLVNILSNPVAALGAGLTLPFLNLGELRRNPQIAQNDYEQAVIGFRQSLLRALGEVENALSSLTTLRETAQRQAALVAEARRIDALTEVRFRAGAIALREWLITQESRRQAELAQVDAELNLLLAQAQLHQALGTATGLAMAAPP
ncbi:MAG: efflux transporter outer membrane subunit [Pseudomonadota bacterium]|nr:efflux transporter outer membrane subunit [Pseudomonadota bacterium]